MAGRARRPLTAGGGSSERHDLSDLFDSVAIDHDDEGKRGGLTDMRQVTFEVNTSPPTKSEALSIFNVKHSHHARVRPLLEAVRDVLQRASWDPDTELDLAIEVVVHGARPASDATNILGGLGDVLERKTHRALAEVLGDLAEVHLFANDRQIQEIVYRWIPGTRDYYSVTLTELDR